MTDRYTVTEIEEDKHIAVILERQRERERARERERERERDEDIRSTCDELLRFNRRASTYDVTHTHKHHM